MKDRLRYLMRKNQSFIALLLILIMVFNACRDPSGSDFTESVPVGNDTIDITPIDPVYFYVDSDGNFTETDSGRTVMKADKDAYVVFHSDDIESSIM